MGLISKVAIVKWNSTNKLWYMNKGYIFTKMKDEFEVNVKDLTNMSNILVDIECDDCGEILKGIYWYNYKRRLKDDNKYYCKKCASMLYGTENRIKTQLKNSKSFYNWCYDNLSKEVADIIILRWDYKKNIKNGIVLSPKGVSFSSLGLNRKGYWFKCLDHTDHESEQKYIHSFTRGRENSINCGQCNSIASTHKYLEKYFVNKKDIWKYSHGSGKNIWFKCPDCGHKKRMEINKFIDSGFACPKCSDSCTYPEKFMFNFLEQLLGNDFKTQLSKTTFEWCNNYRYDNYIDKIDCIIETHGLQHYKQSSGNWEMGLIETQLNDKDKEKLAKDNSIKNYIAIDCRLSEMEFIKNSILKSDLLYILNFKEEDINWLECHEFACSSLVKIACDLWMNEGCNLTKISKKLKLGTNSIRKYLKQGVELGWCDYDAKEELIITWKQNREKRIIKIICLTTGEIFNSITEASIKYKIYGSSISGCCKNRAQSAGKHPITREKLKWQYYSEYIKSNPIPLPTVV